MSEVTVDNLKLPTRPKSYQLLKKQEVPYFTVQEHFPTRPRLKTITSSPAILHDALNRPHFGDFILERTPFKFLQLTPDPSPFQVTHSRDANSARDSTRIAAPGRIYQNGPSSEFTPFVAGNYVGAVSPRNGNAHPVPLCNQTYSIPTQHEASKFISNNEPPKDLEDSDSRLLKTAQLTPPMLGPSYFQTSRGPTNLAPEFAFSERFTPFSGYHPHPNILGHSLLSPSGLEFSQMKLPPCSSNEQLNSSETPMDKGPHNSRENSIEVTDIHGDEVHAENGTESKSKDLNNYNIGPPSVEEVYAWSNHLMSCPGWNGKLSYARHPGNILITISNLLERYNQIPHRTKTSQDSKQLHQLIRNFESNKLLHKNERLYLMMNLRARVHRYDYACMFVEAMGLTVKEFNELSPGLGKAKVERIRNATEWDLGGIIDLFIVRIGDATRQDKKGVEISRDCGEYWYTLQNMVCRVIMTHPARARWVLNEHPVMSVQLAKLKKRLRTRWYAQPEHIPSDQL